MHKRGSLSKKVQILLLAGIIGATSTIFGCREQPAGPSAASPAVAVPAAPAAASATRSKQQAMAALMALPELKEWSSRIQSSSGGKTHGALIEDDPKPKLINGVNYWQFSFVENASDAAHRWESFLVAERGEDILVEDFAADKTLTLAQWRQEKRPLGRSAAK